VGGFNCLGTQSSNPSCANPAANVVLDDNAPLPLPDADVVSQTLYQPANYDTTDPFPAPAPAPAGGSVLTVFNGTAANGTWNLYVVDDLGGDWGNITSGWCVDLTMTSPPATATNTPTRTPTITPTITPTRTPPITPIPGSPTATPTITPLPAGAWLARAPYPIPISDPAVVGQGGYLYSFGGRSTGGATTAAYRYDPAANSWTPLAALPEPLAAVSAVGDGTNIYLFNGGTFSNHAYRYDPAGNGYFPLAAAPLGTYAQTAGYLNGAAYRIGGQASGGTTSSVDLYNPTTNTWAAGPPYPQAAYFLMAAVLNGSLYGAGGAGGEDLSKTYRLTGSTWDDTGAPDLPATRWGAASGALNGKWLLAGGNEAGSIVNSALLWDGVGGDPWQPLPPLLAARHRLGGAAVGPAFFAIGGEDSGGTPTTNVQEYIDPCPISFSDVHPTDYFYTPVLYLACHGVIGGYSDGTFRPANNTTRGQLSKIIVLAYNLAIQTPAPGSPTFADVPEGSTFFPYVETAVAHAIVSGYPCGTVNPQTGVAEPCDGANRPYYRVSNNVTRGQLTKIVVVAANQVQGWPLLDPATASFSDVPTGSTFYQYVETAVCHHVLGGYSDGTFRPVNPATRGQISKIIYNAITDNTATCTAAR
jgi:hypothetical protein